jgi:hypothetical protein
MIRVKHPRLFSLLVFWIIPGICMAQVVNIEERRIHTDTTGLSGDAGAAFMATKNTQEFMALSSDAHLQYKKKRSLFLVLGELNFIKGASDKFLNDGFGHVRYNYKVNSVVRWELFDQIQYNKIRNVNLRWLSGTGPRFKLYEGKSMRFYLGTLVMYEYEEIYKQALPNRDYRMSAYLSWTVQINKVLSHRATTYYQPRLDNFNDYRWSGQYSLLIKISKNLSFKTDYTFIYDEYPPIGIPKLFYTLKEGIAYLF